MYARIWVLILIVAGLAGLAGKGLASPIPDNSEYQQQRCVDNCG